MRRYTHTTVRLSLFLFRRRTTRLFVERLRTNVRRPPSVETDANVLRVRVCVFNVPVSKNIRLVTRAGPAGVRARSPVAARTAQYVRYGRDNSRCRDDDLSVPLPASRGCMFVTRASSAIKRHRPRQRV